MARAGAWAGAGRAVERCSGREYGSGAGAAGKVVVVALGEKEAGHGALGRRREVGVPSARGRREKREERGKEEKRKGKKKKMEKEKWRERKRGRKSGIRGVTDARSATRGAWARVSATRGSRKK